MTDATEGEKDNIWNRLRRRKVVQWGIAYAAGAWGFLQGLAYVSTLLDWPAQLQRLAGLALLLGLPIALVLAWYHGDRGERRVTRTELAILTLLFLVGGGLFWRYQYTSAASESRSAVQPATTSMTSAVSTTDRSIAVLPFVNMSSDREQEYFADGISEELLNLLAQIPELRVIARTSSFAFKGKEADIAEIARKLNVANVLEGSVRSSGDRLRITAQLIRTSDSSHLWSQTYDRQMADVFAVQDEIAAAVVEELKLKLLGDAPKSRATEPQAYAMFLKAREFSRQATASAFDQSIELYKQAITIDPAYAAAWAGLAVTYIDQAAYVGRLPDEANRLARDAANKALALDPKYAPAHAALGSIATQYDRDLESAARYLEQALALDPANPDVLGSAALLARRLGRIDEAIELGEYQMARDPLNASGHDTLAYSYRYAGRLDEALAERRAALSLSPSLIGAHWGIGEELLQMGEAGTALAEFKREPDEASRLIGLSMAYHALGKGTESDAALAELIAKHEIWPCNIAYVLAFRGEADQAFEWMERAVERRDPLVGAIPVHPMFANLHKDARWLPFLRKHGMAPEQLAAIRFDVTVPK